MPLFTDTDIDNMLQALGQAATIDDGTTDGLSVWCKLLDPQTLVGEFGMTVEMTDPAAKVRTSAVEDVLDRGVLFSTGGKDYRVKRFEPRRSGMTVLFLEDA